MGFSNNYSCIASPDCLHPVVTPAKFTEPAISIFFTNSNTGESRILHRYSQGEQTRTVNVIMSWQRGHSISCSTPRLFLSSICGIDSEGRLISSFFCTSVSNLLLLAPFLRNTSLFRGFFASHVTYTSLANAPTCGLMEICAALLIGTAGLQQLHCARQSSYSYRNLVGGDTSSHIILNVGRSEVEEAILYPYLN